MSISDQLKTDFDRAKLLLIGHCDRIYLGRNLVPRVFCVHGARYSATKTLVEADDVTFCLRGYGKSLILHASTFTTLSFRICHVGVHRVFVLLRICRSK